MFISIFVFSIVLIGCKPSTKIEDSDKEQTNQMKELDFETAEKGLYSFHKGKKSYVINNKNEWEKLWVILNIGTGPSDVPLPPLPDIDFEKNTLIAVFMGEFTTGGHTIEIYKVVENKNNVEVSVNEKSPGKDCILTQAFTQPYHIVKIKKVDKGVIFRVDNEIIDCN